jgi:hypothetical protein
MSRFRIGFAVMAMIASAVAVPIVLVAGTDAAVAVTNCTFTGPASGITTLNGSCTTDATLTLPAGTTTFDGGSFTITATDPGGGVFFSGPVLTNNTADTTMNVKDLTISGNFNTAPSCTTLMGIWFNNAGGTVSNVNVEGISQHTGFIGTGSSCGVAIRADATTAQTLTITNTKVSGYQRAGIDGRGPIVMDISGGSVVGPPENRTGSPAQNSIVYVGNGSGTPSGTVSDTTISGRGAENPNVSSTAILISSAKDVTITHNVISSQTGAPGTDAGIIVQGTSSGITISDNQIGRAAVDTPDSTGIGILVFSPASATPICNTFSGWAAGTNIVGAEQISCTPPLPNGAECHAYSAPAPTVESGKNLDSDGNVIDVTPFTWKVVSGALPPGLTLASSGAITGTPTKTGTFDFTVQATDTSGLEATRAQTITVAPGCATTTTTTASTTATTTATTTSGTATAGTAPITKTTVPVTG